MHSSNRNPFSERSWLSCFGGLRDPFDDLCCVEGISIWFDRLRKARGSNGTGESIQKRQFFSILLVLVSDPGSVSPFFRDELLAPVLHFVSVGRGERGSSRRGLYHERRKEVNLFQIYNMDSGNVAGLSCRSEWIILSTEVNLCLLGKRIASYKFCLGRIDMYFISITMKFINEVVNKWKS